MVFDYSKLRGLAREKGKTQEAIAAIVGMKEATYSQKINNNSEFKQSEILRICDVLAIPHEQIHAYFFTLGV
ncbi:MAG: DUF739 family protein [Ruminococcaceae bacterium]|nr:DUF739 family protein [Oscillospiraceae bacterium]